MCLCVFAKQVYVHCRASFIVVIRIVVAMKKSARHKQAAAKGWGGRCKENQGKTKGKSKGKAAHKRLGLSAVIESAAHKLICATIECALRVCDTVRVSVCMCHCMCVYLCVNVCVCVCVCLCLGLLYACYLLL